MQQFSKQMGCLIPESVSEMIGEFIKAKTLSSGNSGTTRSGSHGSVGSITGPIMRCCK